MNRHGRALSPAAMSRVRTVVLPARVLKRWDRLAAAQLCAAVADLAQENEQLRRDLASAEDAADHWHANTLALAGDDGCITVEGLLQTQQQLD